MRKRALVITFAIIVLAITGVLAYRYLVQSVDTGKTAVVRRGTIGASVTTLGRVQPKRQLSLSTRASGKVKSILVREGDLVSAGALILELDAPGYADAVEQAERSVKIRKMQLEEALKAPDSASIDLARARLRVATAARLKAQKDYDKIAAKPDAEKSDEALKLETAKLEYDVAKAEFDRTLKGASELQIERLRADLREAETALKQAREQLAYTRIEAPFTGTIMAIDARLGENVHGFSPLVRLADLSQLQIRAEIDEIDIPAVAVGQSVQIRLDAFPAQTLKGRVERIMPGVSEARGMTTYGALVDFENTSLPIRPGMGANLVITTQTVENALLIPKRAVRQAGRHKVVRVLVGRQQAEVVITTGLSNESEIEVLSGLQEGQVVLLD